MLAANQVDAMARLHTGSEVTIGNEPTDVLICAMLEFRDARVAILPLYGEISRGYEIGVSNPLRGL